MHNAARSIPKQYHEQTKHHFRHYARSLGYMDWANQPNPFRRFSGAPLVKLLLSRDEDSPLYDDLFFPGRIPSQPLSLASVSAFFEFALAISAWKEFRGSRWSLRINPSSGNLHPTEGYVVLPGVAGINDGPGVFHYAPLEHALERRTLFDEETWCELMAGFPPGSFLVGLTSILWREAWKYGERAYRYCQHDAGHALAAVSLSAAVQGWPTVLLSDLGDDDVSALLGIDRAPDFADVEREEPEALLAVFPLSRSFSEDLVFARGLPPNAIARVAAGQWSGSANRLSKEHVEWPIIDEIARACQKPRAEPSVISNSAFNIQHSSFRIPPSIRPGILAKRILRQRRSALDFDGRTGMPARTFLAMLGRVMPRFDRPPWAMFGPPVCTHLALFVHLVDGIEPGLYFLARDPAADGRLRAVMNPRFRWETPEGCPPSLPLFLLTPGDAREVAAQISCHQAIAGDSAFSLGMIAEFDEPLRRFGDWFYRRLFWETGVIGHVLYLEAEAAGLRATGIGCFFDDPMHHVLGLADTSFQSLYHFTIGGPVDDPRLTTLPPYPASRLV
jgi:SagB-type dehydrogenase family enzyme